MSFNRKLKHLLALALSVIAAVACARDSAPPPTRSVDLNAPPISANKSDAPKIGSEIVPSDSDAVRAAKKWIDALRARDMQKLRDASAVPFEFRELVEHPKCETKRAAKSDDIDSAVECLVQDDLLMEEITTQTEPVTEPISEDNLPSWAASLKAQGFNGRLVQVRLPGNGVSYQFMLLATSTGVPRVWKFAEYDPN